MVKGWLSVQISAIFTKATQKWLTRQRGGRTAAALYKDASELPETSNALRQIGIWQTLVGAPAELSGVPSSLPGARREGAERSRSSASRRCGPGLAAPFAGRAR